MSDSYGVAELRNHLIEINNNMNIMASILHGMNDRETKRAVHLIRHLEWDKDSIDNRKALAMLDEIESSDVFNFSQDVVDLIQNIESSQSVLVNYINALKRLV